MRRKLMPTFKPFMDQNYQAEPFARRNAIIGLDHNNDYLYVYGGSEWNTCNWTKWTNNPRLIWRYNCLTREWKPIDNIIVEPASQRLHITMKEQHCDQYPGCFVSKDDGTQILFICDGRPVEMYNFVIATNSKSVHSRNIRSTSSSKSHKNQEAFECRRIDYIDVDHTLNSLVEHIAPDNFHLLYTDAEHFYFWGTHTTLVDDEEIDEYLICELSFNAGVNRWEWKKFSVEASQNLSPDERALLAHLLDFCRDKRICFLYRNNTIGLIVQEVEDSDESFQNLILFNLDQRKFTFEKLYPDEQENGFQWPPAELIYLKSIVFRDYLLLFGSIEHETSGCESYPSDGHFVSGKVTLRVLQVLQSNLLSYEARELDKAEDGCAYIFGGVVWNKKDSSSKIADQNSNENSNDRKFVEVNSVQRIWLQPPSLKKLAMLSIASSLPPNFWTKTTKGHNHDEPLFSEPVEFMRYVKDNVYKV
ncbi:hypothetical protein Ddc_15037 [Ditylenchus destructor]|nr:hypothetical protein Ddc_15037 [Ditylenchus destructor]